MTIKLSYWFFTNKVKWFSVLFLSIVAIAFTQLAASAEEPLHFEVDRHMLMVQQTNRTVRFFTEVAQTPKQREAGLMYRTNFPKNHAMLFTFEEPMTIRMWMANTPLSLDMIFLDKTGKVVDIRTNTVPYSHDIITSKELTSFVIEVRAGVVKEQGIALGQIFLHPAICGTCGGKYEHAR